MSVEQDVELLRALIVDEMHIILAARDELHDVALSPLIVYML